MGNDAEYIGETVDSGTSERLGIDADPRYSKQDRLGGFAGIAATIVVVGLSAIKIFEGPVQRLLGGFYKSAAPGTQLLIFAGLIFILIVGAISLAITAMRAMQRKRRLEDAMDALDRTTRELEELRKRTEPLENDLTQLRQQLEPLEKLRDRTSALFQSFHHIWVRNPVHDIPEVMALSERKTAFVSFLNLKGGVGKTFLAANIAAILSSDEESPLNSQSILLLDLDFQATLSEGTIDTNQLGLMYQQKATTERLWDLNSLDGEALNKLNLSMNHFPNVHVMPADNPLDQADYRVQTQHLIYGKENRFHFRRLLHQHWLYLQYGLVLFDCPPRLTASSINALACSDYIVVPTRLENFSVRAVSNTLSILAHLKNAGVVKAKILGVIPNEVTRRDSRLIRDHQNAYAELQLNIEQYVESEALFAETACAGRIAPGQLGLNQFDIVAAHNAQARQALRPVAEEFGRRIQINQCYDLYL